MCFVIAGSSGYVLIASTWGTAEARTAIVSRTHVRRDPLETVEAVHRCAVEALLAPLAVSALFLKRSFGRC